MAGNLIQSGKEKEPMGRLLREEATNKMAVDWIRQHLASLAPSPSSIAEGEIISHYAKW